MTVGRPTKYKPEYCDMLIEHMAQGLSFESFGGIIRVHRETLYEWCKVYPEFSDAKGVGKSCSLLWWEQLGRGLSSGKLKGNAQAWTFNIKNHHNWTDKNETTISTGDQVKIEYRLNDSKSTEPSS